MSVVAAQVAAGVSPERLSVAWLLAAFVITTVVTRSVTRYIRHRRDRVPHDTAITGPIRDILIGGVHVHHQVWGILLMILDGFLMVAYRPDGWWAHVAAAAFGTGAALTLDQFAMWLHLEDVYWAPRGRTSVTALITTLVVGVGLLLGTDPLGLAVGSPGWPLPRWVVPGVLALNLLTAFTCLAKGKPWLSVVGLFLPGVAWWGAARLARPDSWWGRRYYPPGSRRAVTAAVRQRTHRQRWDRLVDVIGGPPSRHTDDQPKSPQRLSTD